MQHYIDVNVYNVAYVLSSSLSMFRMLNWAKLAHFT